MRQIHKRFSKRKKFIWHVVKQVLSYKIVTVRLCWKWPINCYGCLCILCLNRKFFLHLAFYMYVFIYKFILLVFLNIEEKDSLLPCLIHSVFIRVYGKTFLSRFSGGQQNDALWWDCEGQHPSVIRDSIKADWCTFTRMVSLQYTLYELDARVCLCVRELQWEIEAETLVRTGLPCWEQVNKNISGVFVLTYTHCSRSTTKQWLLWFTAMSSIKQKEITSGWGLFLGLFITIAVAAFYCLCSCIRVGQNFEFKNCFPFNLWIIICVLYSFADLLVVLFTQFVLLCPLLSSKDLIFAFSLYLLL